MTIWAKIQTRFEALHRWPDPPKEVYFLKFPHRHMFHVTVWVEQFHTERDVEYILFKRWLDELLHQCAVDPASVLDWSCEMWAEVICKSVVQKFEQEQVESRGEGLTQQDARRIKVEVLEDGENGALVEM